MDPTISRRVEQAHKGEPSFEKCDPTSFGKGVNVVLDLGFRILGFGLREIAPSLKLQIQMHRQTTAKKGNLSSRLMGLMIPF